MIAPTYKCGCPPKSMFHSEPIKSSNLPTQLPKLYSPNFLPQSPQNCLLSKTQKSCQPFDQISSRKEFPDYSSPMGHNALYPPCSSLSAYPKSNVPNTKYELSQLYPSSMLPPNITNNEVPGCICLPSNQTQPELNEVCEDACPGVADTTAGKVVSEIVNTGLPYKEIEAIINDNRMVIRMQKDPAENEFDPPCDCDDNNLSRLKTPAGEEKSFMGNQNGNNVVFQMASANPTQINQNTTLNRSCDQNDVGCRTVTVFPQVDVTPSAPAVPTTREDEKKEKKDKIDKPRMPRSIDLEENPNIFLLRIRKKSDNGEKKTNIDLEFRTPRPWRTETKPIKKVVPAKPHQKDTSKDKDEGKKKKKKGKDKKKNKKK